MQETEFQDWFDNANAGHRGAYDFRDSLDLPPAERPKQSFSIVVVDIDSAEREILQAKPKVKREPLTMRFFKALSLELNSSLHLMDRTENSDERSSSHLRAHRVAEVLRYLEVRMAASQLPPYIMNPRQFYQFPVFGGMHI